MLTNASNRTKVPVGGFERRSGTAGSLTAFGTAGSPPETFPHEFMHFFFPVHKSRRPESRRQNDSPFVKLKVSRETKHKVRRVCLALSHNILKCRFLRKLGSVLKHRLGWVCTNETTGGFEWRSAQQLDRSGRVVRLPRRHPRSVPSGGPVPQLPLQRHEGQGGRHHRHHRHRVQGAILQIRLRVLGLSRDASSCFCAVFQETTIILLRCSEAKSLCVSCCEHLHLDRKFFLWLTAELKSFSPRLPPPLCLSLSPCLPACLCLYPALCVFIFRDTAISAEVVPWRATKGDDTSASSHGAYEVVRATCMLLPQEKFVYTL